MYFSISSNSYLEEIKEKWGTLQQTPDIFAYKLNISHKKNLVGCAQFYTEFNPQRTTLRRAPQRISTLTPIFDETKFNFKKVQAQERMMDIPFANSKVAMIINRSPLTEYHTLICPDLDEGQPQIITLKALHFCVAFLLQLDDEKNFRIGYNSPGALASVNHLHLHLLHINRGLYIDNAKLEPLANGDIFRLSCNMPTEAICFVIRRSDSNAVKTNKLQQFVDFLQWLCTEDLPHNIFMTPSRETTGQTYFLKLFVYARDHHCIIKDVSAFNVGFCELSGYIPVGSKELFEELTEEKIVCKICQETGKVFSKIYGYFLNK